MCSSMAQAASPEVLVYAVPDAGEAPLEVQIIVRDTVKIEGCAVQIPGLGAW